MSTLFWSHSLITYMMLTENISILIDAKPEATFLIFKEVGGGYKNKQTKAQSLVIE